MTVTHCLHLIEATCKKADGRHKVGYDSISCKDYIINKNFCDTGCKSMLIDLSISSSASPTLLQV